MNVFNIPRHEKCTNCGRCCGVIPATVPEVNAIRNYIAVNGITPIRHGDGVTCPFRDDKNKKCLIYPVRPVICRLFGVAKGMECANGNTHEIDGTKFLPKGASFENTMILNFIKW